MNQIMNDGKARRIFINGREYGGGGGGTVTVNDTALVEFVITAADPANTPLLPNTVIVLTDSAGNVTTLVLGGREIRVVKGTYQIDVTCEDVGDWDDTRAITDDCVIEIELGAFALDGSWGYPRALIDFETLWSNPAYAHVEMSDEDLAANYDIWSRTVEQFDGIWSNAAYEHTSLPAVDVDADGYSRTVNEYDAIWSNADYEHTTKPHDYQIDWDSAGWPHNAGWWSNAAYAHSSGGLQAGAQAYLGAAAYGQYS